MSFYNFFRDIFGFRNNDHRETTNNSFEDRFRHRDDFDNPFERPGEDDYDDGYGFRQPGHGEFGFGGFSIHSNPLEIARYFEEQLNSMSKNIFGFNFDNMMAPFAGGMEDHFQNSLPGIEAPKQENLRDEVLKPGYGNLPSRNLVAPSEDRVDLDLDGKITSAELSKVWKDSDGSFENRYPNSGSDQRSPFFSNSYGSSVTYTTISRKPDGTVEQRRTVRDSKGNETTTVTRQIDGKSHTVVINKDQNGNKTETETFEPVAVNPTDPSDFAADLMMPFLGITDNQRDDRNPLRDIPWHQFFGPNPKL